MDKRNIILVISIILFVIGIIGIIVLLIPIYTYECSRDYACEEGARSTIVYPQDLGKCNSSGNCSKKGSAVDSGGNIAILSIASLFAIAAIGMFIYLLSTKKQNKTKRLYENDI